MQGVVDDHRERVVALILAELDDSELRVSRARRADNLLLIVDAELLAAVFVAETPVEGKALLIVIPDRHDRRALVARRGDSGIGDEPRQCREPLLVALDGSIGAQLRAGVGVGRADQHAITRNAGLPLDLLARGAAHLGGHGDQVARDDRDAALALPHHNGLRHQLGDDAFGDTGREVAGEFRPHRRSDPNFGGADKHCGRHERPFPCTD